jgi:hypothetical protein
MKLIWGHGLTISVSDPIQDWVQIQLGHWIQIRIRNPDPEPAKTVPQNRKKGRNFMFEELLVGLKA